MKTIFTLDRKDYTPGMPVFEKTVVRALICRDGLYAMQQSGSGLYKIPGGGIEEGESYVDTLIREVREETGLHVDASRIEEIGATDEIRRDVYEDERIYVCHTWFYRCGILPEVGQTQMTPSELALGFHPVWVSLDEIVRTNACIEEKGWYWKMRDYLFVRWYQSQLQSQVPLWSASSPNL